MIKTRVHTTSARIRDTTEMLFKHTCFIVIHVVFFFKSWILIELCIFLTELIIEYFYCSICTHQENMRNPCWYKNKETWYVASDTTMYKRSKDDGANKKICQRSAFNNEQKTTPYCKLWKRTHNSYAENIDIIYDINYEKQIWQDNFLQQPLNHRLSTCEKHISNVVGLNM